MSEGAAGDRAAHIADIVSQVRAARKYAHLAPAVIARVAQRELARREPADRGQRTLGQVREVVKAVKRELHRIGGAYLQSEPRYERWLEELRQARKSSDPERVRETCRRIMAQHASTRERLPMLEDLYTAMHQAFGPLGSVLDLACGLNPLAVPWMSLKPQAVYHAYDMYDDLAAFLREALPLLGLRGHAESRDLLALPESGGALPAAQVVLILKTLPCWEQPDPSAALRLLDMFDALPDAPRNLVISYPAHSLGRRDKGMVETYTRQFAALATGRPWHVERHLFSAELAFFVTRL
ncbi:MAG: 16S rRNA methyltransferase [Anaerolineae bacterium]|nr:16S rRNA methyltransferase [Anaerolineae bacterium]